MSLEDDYIPSLSKDTQLKLLKKINEKVQSQLILEWFDQYGLSNRSLGRFTRDSLEDDFKFETGSRKTLSRFILNRYWIHGLNLGQLSDIDFYTMFAHPTRFKWNSSTIFKSTSEKFRPHYNISRIIADLSNQLTSFYLTHISSKHDPKLNIQYIRVQFFERQMSHDHERKPKLLSRTPYYIAILDDQEIPILIHSSGDDPASNLILETVKRVISNLSSYNLTFKNNEPKKETIKSMENMLKCLGTSRYDNAMGRWSGYGRGDFEMSPLIDINDHQSITGKKIDKNDKLMKSNLKFKGDINYPNGYKSERSASKVTFKVTDSKDDITLGFKFYGTDVFGGLHQLCDQGLMDVDKVPGWLSGENGTYSGIIQDGDFIRKSNKRNGGLI